MSGEQVSGRAFCASGAALLFLSFVSPVGTGQEIPETPLYVAIAGVGGSMSTLTVAYPSDPGLEQARKDAAALAAAGGWTISPPQRADTPDGVLYEAQISPAVSMDATGQVPYFPILSAFRRYPRIKFSFVGEAAGVPGQYHDENPYVAAEWTRGGRSVTYDFRIKKPDFRDASDVRLIDRPADEPLPPPPLVHPAARNVGVLWALLVVGALGTGVFVWGLTWWLLTRWQGKYETGGEVIVNVEANPAIASDAGSASE